MAFCQNTRKRANVELIKISERMKKSRILSTLIIAAICCSSSVFAQPDSKAPQRKQLTQEERIEMRIERMERELMLDDKTSEKFASLYKEYIEAMKQCRPDCKKEMKKGECPKRNEMTDEDLCKRMEACFAMQKKAIETKETYYNKFKKILNARQLEKLFCNHGRPGIMGPKGKRQFKNPMAQQGGHEKPCDKAGCHHQGPQNP